MFPLISISVKPAAASSHPPTNQRTSFTENGKNFMDHGITYGELNCDLNKRSINALMQTIYAPARLELNQNLDCIAFFIPVSQADDELDLVLIKNEFKDFLYSFSLRVTTQLILSRYNYLFTMSSLLCEREQSS